MRKVFVLVTGLFLLTLFAACSEDSTPTPPSPPVDFGITTAAMALGYTCSPYHMTLEAEGGVAPYSWSITSGSLPSGLTLSSDGKITGLCMDSGDYAITVRVEDSSETPKTDEQEYALSVNAPSNPSLAIFYDSQASICSAGTAAWTPLTCYVYIMLEDSDVGCAQACEFKLRLTDIDGVDLDAGTDYAIINSSHPHYVAVSLGDFFNGIAISFSRPMYGPSPIEIASFGILLLEDLNNLSFKFEANPGGILGLATCEEGYPKVQVSGREAPLNY
jgi:hypothetical protein